MRPSREIVARGAIFEDLRLRVQRGIQETAGEPKNASRTHVPIQKMTWFLLWRGGGAWGQPSLGGFVVSGGCIWCNLRRIAAAGARMWRNLRGIVASGARLRRNLQGIVVSGARMWRNLRGIVASGARI